MRSLLLAAAAALTFAAPASAQAPAKAANDYGKPEAWLCRPDNNAFCDIDLTATVVPGSGALAKETYQKAADPKVDCFYVYPTVSNDPGANSDMTPNVEERNVASRQLARFGSVCRIFAPLYRQITLGALRANTAGTPMAGLDREMAYNDVRDAWRHYLANDNKGRPVILYGHSQGSGMLKRLIAEEIDGKPAQRQIVSAYLIGTNILVPAGKDVGGDFKSMPLCRTKTQTGCVVTYVTFRESAPPPANSRFGRTTQAGMQVACVNPAAPAGGKAVLRSYFGAKSMHPTALPPKPWVTPEKAIDTSFVTTPGLVSGQCVSNENGSYLAISVNADPKDPRTDEITGDHYANGQLLPDWGLHSLDTPVAMGSLIDLAKSQTATFSAR